MSPPEHRPTLGASTDGRRHEEHHGHHSNQQPPPERTDPRPEPSRNTNRLVRILAATIVAAIAAWSSYWHMVHVALRYGERSEVAYVLPLSVDGVLTIAAIVMAEDRRAAQPVRRIAKIAFLIGLSASITANVAAAQPSPGGRLIAAWPAVALLLIVEMLVFTRPASPGALPLAEQEASTEGAPHQLPQPNPKLIAAHDQPEQPPAPHHKLHPEPHQPTGTKQRRRPTSTTRQLAADLLAADPHLTREELAARIGISSRRLRAILSTPPTL